MSRTVLWILTVFLSLAMIALVAVQTYWFKNSIQSKQEQLGLVVNQVLDDISDELIRNETVMTILEEIQPPVVSHQSSAVWNFHIDARSSVRAEGSEEITIREIEIEEDVEPEQVIHESEHPEEENIVVYTQPHQSIKNQKIEIIDDSILVVLGEDEMKGIGQLIFCLPTSPGCCCQGKMSGFNVQRFCQSYSF